MKRVFIVHGWEFSPNMHWYPWLKGAMEKKGFKVAVPAMPDTDAPDITKWVARLAKAVGTPDEDTYFVGHSIGAQTILRYLQTAKTKVGGCVFVAPWLTLTDEALPDATYRKIAKPWLTTPIKYATVRKRTRALIVLFADDDPYVSLENRTWFKEKLDATTKVFSGRGHFTADDGITKVPEVLKAVLDMAK